ncbi:MAG: hypothetical protein ACR2OV_14455 [Hyphomicrobiaceae bacterium]
MTSEPLILDSVTHLEPVHRGRASHCGSHGGVYAGYYAAKMGVGAVILNDAGIGREAAGLAGVKLLDDLGVPAATVSHRSARIGDGNDGLARGTLSFVNAAAERLGVATGMSCREALAVLCRVDLDPAPAPTPLDEARYVDEAASHDGVRVIVMDSISLVTPEDDGHIVVAASHGALLGGRPETAVKSPVFAVVCSDADHGIDDVGVSRLPALDERGIAGACISAFSARIGDGRSLIEDGFVSVVNRTTVGYGGTVGMSCRELVDKMVTARAKQLGEG